MIGVIAAVIPPVAVFYNDDAECIGGSGAAHRDEDPVSQGGVSCSARRIVTSQSTFCG